MLETHKPYFEELGFRQKLLADERTMSYNEAWGGTIAFSRESWQKWYHDWLEADETERYYRYLRDTDIDAFVGEIAYHHDEKRGIWLCDVIVLAEYRNRGYGTEGIRLLFETARKNGITVLYDDIAADNPACRLFLKNGFIIDHQTDDVIMLRKDLNE